MVRALLTIGLDAQNLIGLIVNNYIIIGINYRYPRGKVQLDRNEIDAKLFIFN